MDVDDIVEKFLIQQLNLDEGSDQNKQTLPANFNLLSIPKEFRDVMKVIQEKKSNTVAALREARRENLYYLLNVKADWLELLEKQGCLNQLITPNDLVRRLNQIKKKLQEPPPTKADDEKEEDSWLPSGPNPEIHRWSSQAVDLKKIHGFEDKGMIMERLLLKEEAAAVGIVGVAGVGKTALCQLAFNRQQVQNNFPLRIWLCFSNPAAEGLSLEKRIFSCLGFEDEVIDRVAPDKRQLALRRQLKRGRYLIVLDDIWTMEEEHLSLFSFLTTTAGGSVIVTSRYEMFLEKMPKINKQTLLPLVDNMSCWNIFSDEVMKDGSIDRLPEEMKKLEDKIVGKCEGLPLMAKMLGQIGYDLAKIHLQTQLQD